MTELKPYIPHRKGLKLCPICWYGYYALRQYWDKGKLHIFCVLHSGVGKGVGSTRDEAVKSWNQCTENYLRRTGQYDN